MEQPRRRLSAVWFADIVGYTELSTRDEPAAMQLVQALQQIARATVEEFEGRIVKFMGDAVLAEFSSTESAVRAAVALQERYTAEAAAQGHTSVLHTGVHLGEVTATPDGDLYGDGINTAARLQHEASPGQIIISEDVWRQLRQRPEFRFNSLGAVELRGITTAVGIYDVLFGARAALAREQASPPAAVPPITLPPAQAAPARSKWPLIAGLLALTVIAGAYAILRSKPDAFDAAAPAQTTGADSQSVPVAPSPMPPQPAASTPQTRSASDSAARPAAPIAPPEPAAADTLAAADSSATRVTTGTLPPREMVRVRRLLTRFAEAAVSAEPLRQIKRVFPAVTPAQAQAVMQLRTHFGPDIAMNLSGFEPLEVRGDTVSLRFVLATSSSKRPRTPIGFHATVVRESNDWHFTALRREGRGGGPR